MRADLLFAIGAFAAGYGLGAGAWWLVAFAVALLAVAVADRLMRRKPVEEVVVDAKEARRWLADKPRIRVVETTMREVER